MWIDLKTFLEKKYSIFGGVTLNVLLFAICCASLAGLLVGFSGVLMWEIGEVIDTAGILEPEITNALFVISGLLIVCLCFFYPFLGLVLYTLFLPFRNEDYVLLSAGGADVRIGDFFLLPAMVAWFTIKYVLVRNDFVAGKTGLELPVSMFIFITILSVSWTFSYGGSI